MSGIPVYTQSPIHEANASGTTPQTAAPPAQSSPLAPRTNATTTTTSSSSTPYLAAQPGAPAVPAPTSAAQRYAPVQQLQPTPTTKTEDAGPAPPQPGPFPTPRGGIRSDLPPPPKAGEKYIPPSRQEPQPQSYMPPQMGIPPPTQAYRAQPPSSSTSATTTSPYAYPAALPQDAAPRQSLEHPPGYVQNPYASTFTSDQRRAQEVEQNSSAGFGVLGSDTSSSTAVFGDDSEGVWNSAKTLLATAGRKLSDAEAEVWKMVKKH